jgi:hypothetical protein
LAFNKASLMITPSFNLTATERVLPKLALDFTTASLDSRVTFTRSGDTATVTNSSGLIVPINANLPRFDYDPITLVCKGLLIEEARTNAYNSSGTSIGSAWQVNAYTVNAIDITTSPIGTGQKMLETTANTQHLIDYRTSASWGAASATATLSWFVRSGLGRDYIYLDLDDGSQNGGTSTFNLALGVLVSSANTGTGTNTIATIKAYQDNWYRVSLTTTFVATRTSARGILGTFSDAGVTNSYAGDTSKGLYAAGRQLEAGAFATSYIPTEATALTRNADNASMSGTNFSSWYNASEGTFLFRSASADAVGLGPVHHVFAATDGTVGNRIRAYLYGNVGTQVTVGGVGQATLVDGTLIVNNTFYTGVLGYKANDFGLSVDAVTPLVATSGTIPTVDSLDIGSQLGAGFLSGHIQKLFYYPQKLTTNEIQAFSKG